MAEVVVLLNPLDVSRRRRLTLAEGELLLAWVEANEPARLAARGLRQRRRVHGPRLSRAGA